MKLFYTTAVLAKALGICQSHCQALILRGEIPQPDAVLQGISGKPPHYAYSSGRINLIKLAFRRKRRKRKVKIDA